MTPSIALLDLPTTPSTQPTAQPPPATPDAGRRPRLARGSCSTLLVVEDVVLATGVIVSERYRLAACTARGKHAELWNATDTVDADRPVVIKVAARRSVTFDVAALTHDSPHVAAVLAHGALADGRSYVVLERLAGLTLRRWLAAYSVMTPAGMIAIVAQLARALGNVHADALVHGAITPEHVMIRPDVNAPDGVRVTVLGLGTTLGAGSPGYLAPEQLAGGHAEARTDVFALGVLVVELLTGRGPFPISSVDVEVAFARRRAGMFPRVELPDAIRTVIERALAGEPDKRWPSASAFVDALRAAIS